jgi:hypothetical protein
MAHAYSDPFTGPYHAIDAIGEAVVEVFYLDVRAFTEAEVGTWMNARTMALDPSPFTNSLDRHYIDCSSLGGWYWCPVSVHACGYLPDSDPMGPFQTEADALADAQGGN